MKGAGFDDCSREGTDGDTLKRRPVYNRDWERTQYVDEQLEFLLEEYLYIRHSVDGLPTQAPTDGAFQKNATLYLSSLKDFLDAALQASDEPRDSTHPGRAEIAHGLPDLVRALTTALLQRRESPVPRPISAPIDRPFFAPSEITIEYPMTIRAAENLNSDYHARLFPFFASLPRHVPPPLIILSGPGPAKMKTAEPALLHPTINSWDRVSAFLTAAYVSLPSWSPQHIRTFSIIAHEHVHRVLQLVRFVGLESQSRFQQQQLDATTGEITGNQFHDQFKRVASELSPFVGAFTVRLFEEHYDLRELLLGFLCDHDLPGLSSSPPDAVILDPDHVVGVRNDIAVNHAGEIISDIGATVLAGPAYAFAFRTCYPGFKQSDALRLRVIRMISTGRFLSSHPPTLYRYHLHNIVLRQLGFRQIARGLERDLSKDSSPIYDDPLRRYTEFLDSAPIRKLVTNLVDLFVTAAEQHAPRNTFSCQSTSSSSLSEQAIRDRWRGVTRKVEEQHAFLGTQLRDYFPAEFLNAIWQKRSHHPGERPRHRMSWRVALRNRV